APEVIDGHEVSAFIGGIERVRLQGALTLTKRQLLSAQKHVHRLSRLFSLTLQVGLRLALPTGLRSRGLRSQVEHPYYAHATGAGYDQDREPRPHPRSLSLRSLPIHRYSSKTM